MNDNTRTAEGQEVLHDTSATGKERPWQAKKEANTYLAMAYKNISTRKQERLGVCAERLTFRLEGNGVKKLHHMDSCRVRLCPMCGWRRSLKTFANVKAVMEGMESERQYAYLFLTLTVQNCEGRELRETIDAMMRGWQRLSQTKAFRDVAKGWYRALEVTHKVDEGNQWHDTYHPHFHCVIAVNKSYFKKEGYIKHAQWAEMWQRACRLWYLPDVDVRRVKGSTAQAVAEAAKYAVKEDEFIIKSDWVLTEKTVEVLDRALEARRLIAYGGKMREWHKKLNLGDDEDGDLVNVDGETPAEEPDAPTIVFAWNSGYWQYYRDR